MGTRGPHAKPGSSESERGRNSLSRRLPRDPTAKLPTCPPDLSEAGRKFWKSHVRQLHSKGYLTSGDVPAFARLCSTWSQLQELDVILLREGLTVTASTGVMRAHPGAALRTSCEKTFLALAVQFGLTPNARQRVPPAEEPKKPRMRRDRTPVAEMDDNELEEYLFGENE